MSQDSGGFWGKWFVFSLIAGAAAFYITRSGEAAVKIFLIVYVIGWVVFRLARFGEQVSSRRDSSDDGQGDDKV